MSAKFATSLEMLPMPIFAGSRHTTHARKTSDLADTRTTVSSVEAGTSGISSAPELRVSGESGTVYTDNSEGREMTDQAPTTSFGSELVEADNSYLGKIVMDTYETGVHPKTGVATSKYHLAVEPIGFRLKGETNAFHTWNPHVEGDPIKERSGMGMFFAGCKEVFTAEELSIVDEDTGKTRPRRIGHDELLGLVCRWERKDVKWGKNKETGEDITSKGVQYPVARAPEALLEDAAAAKEAQNPDLTDEEAEQVLEVLGKLGEFDNKTAQLTLAKSGFDGALQVKVMNGSALRYLRDNGRIVTGESKGKETVVLF